MKEPLFGMYRAKVVNNKDPQRLGRVVVWIPDVMPMVQDNTGLWARPANNPLGGRNMENNDEHHYMGTSYIPKIGSWVFVFFECGNINRPYYFGALDLENTKVLPENQLGENYEDKWTILKTHKGRCIIISDDPDDRRVEITGQKRILVDPELPENNKGKLGNKYRPTGGDVDESLEDTERLVYEIDGNQTTILFDERIGKEKVLIRTYKGDFLHVDIDERKLQAYFKDDIEIWSQNSIYILADKDIHVKAKNKMFIESVNDMHVLSNNNMFQESINEMDIKSGKDMRQSTDMNYWLKSNENMYQQSIKEMHIQSDESMFTESLDEMHFKAEKTVKLQSLDVIDFKSDLGFNIEQTGSEPINLKCGGEININSTDDLNLYSDSGMVRAFPGISSGAPDGTGVDIEDGIMNLRLKELHVEAFSPSAIIEFKCVNDILLTAQTIHLDGAVTGPVPAGTPASAGSVSGIQPAEPAEESDFAEPADESMDANVATPAIEATPEGSRDT